VEPLKVCFVSSELTPLAKTGGLADVALALPRHLRRAGHDVRLFVPLYGSIDASALELRPVEAVGRVTVPFGRRQPQFRLLTASLAGLDGSVYLIDCPELYGRRAIYTEDPDEHLRFAMLSRAAIESCQRLGWSPDVFHCNDWHAALLPLYLKTLYGWDAMFKRSRTLLTIHNIAYQGVFSAETVGELGLGGDPGLLYQEDLREGRLNFLKTGILYADALSTVSPGHAREIQDPHYGMGLDGLLRERADHLFGILNGVDYDEWSPQKDRLIAYRYSPRSLPTKGKNKKFLLEQVGLPHRPGVPVLGIVSRLTYQKGLDLCFDVLPGLLTRHDLRLVALGSGESRYEGFFTTLQRSFPRKAFFYRGYHEPLAHQIEAGADLFLMPSRYEPCGLNQMFSLKYGTVPIVRRTGGLADTVEPFDPIHGGGTGFVFEHFTADGLRWALELALRVYTDRKAWRRLMLDGMSRDFSWETQADRYVKLYRALAGR